MHLWHLSHSVRKCVSVSGSHRLQRQQICLTKTRRFHFYIKVNEEICYRWTPPQLSLAADSVYIFLDRISGCSRVTRLRNFRDREKVCCLHVSRWPWWGIICKQKSNDSSCSLLSSSFQKEFAAPPPLLFRKLSNPDLSPAATAATKSKLHRQLSQDESWARRSSMAMTGNTHIHYILMSLSKALCFHL